MYALNMLHYRLIHHLLVGYQFIGLIINTFYSKTHILRIETGRHDFTITKFLRLCEALGLPVAVVLETALFDTRDLDVIMEAVRRERRLERKDLGRETRFERSERLVTFHQRRVKKSSELVTRTVVAYCACGW